MSSSCTSGVDPLSSSSLQVGEQLVQLNESGGLDIAGKYNLTAHPRDGTKRKLTPDELIKTLQIEMKTCRVRTKDTASTMNSYTSKPIPNPYPNPIPNPNPNPNPITLTLTLTLTRTRSLRRTPTTRIRLTKVLCCAGSNRTLIPTHPNP